jgi:hypothetical protein
MTNFCIGRKESDDKSIRPVSSFTLFYWGITIRHQNDHFGTSAKAIYDSTLRLWRSSVALFDQSVQIRLAGAHNIAWIDQIRFFVVKDTFRA